MDIRVQPGGEVAIEVFDAVKATVTRSYPKVRPLQQFRAEIGLSPEGKPKAQTTTHVEAGVLFFAEDEQTVVQFRVDGFTFNKLQPYTSWTDIRPEVWRLWRLYKDIVRPAQISRVGMRNINRLTLPSAEFGTYMEALPSIPRELPQQTRSFLTRVVLYDEPRAVSVSLTQAFESPVEGPGVSVLLDIDAYKECEFTPTDEQLDGILEALHAIKNEAFFASITEETARMYE